jgi:hypothetical protein
VTVAECKHKWRTFTPEKAECSACGVKTPWLDIADRLRLMTIERDRALRVLKAIESWSDKRPLLD